MHGTPSTLTDVELERDVQPLTETPVLVPGSAWVRYGELVLKVDVEVVAGTSKAVAIRWLTPTGHHNRAWVWASAAERRR
jgi:hypothetical protein